MRFGKKEAQLENILLENIFFNDINNPSIRNALVKQMREELQDTGKKLFSDFVAKRAVKKLGELGFDVSCYWTGTSTDPNAETFSFEGVISSSCAKGLFPLDMQWEIPDWCTVFIGSGDLPPYIRPNYLEEGSSRYKLDWDYRGRRGGCYLIGTDYHGKDIPFKYRASLHLLKDWLVGFCKKVYMASTVPRLVLSDEFAEAYASVMNPPVILTASLRKE